MDKWVEQAKDAINTVFTDTTVEREATKENLEELKSLIEDYLASLDDSDSEHDFER